MLATRCLRVAVKLERSVRIPFVNLEALRTYKEIYSNVNVPDKYVIGSKDDAAKWPKKDLGMKLGQHVIQVRNYLKRNQIPGWSKEAKELFALGFIVYPRKELYARILLAFKVYIEKFGNAEVPNSFRIGKLDNAWPEVTRGINLGIVLLGIRTQNSYSAIRNELKEMGVVVEPRRSSPDFERDFAALQVFKKIHGHVEVPRFFVIPDNDTNYAVEARGVKLGNWVEGIRSKNHYVEHRQRLTDLGVEISVGTPISYEIIVETVNAFKSVYGHSNLHPSFVVPSGDSRFPEVMWGVNLIPKIKELKLWRKVAAMGVVYVNNQRNVPVNFEALRAYKSLYGDLRVPPYFITGSDRYSGNWPKNLLGLSLGNHVRDIRNRLKYNLYPIEIVKELNEVGFIDNVTEEDEKILIKAFQTYIDKYGHGKVRVSFKIDEKDESWPVETRGIPLGSKLNQIRSGFWPGIREKLRTMGVVVDPDRSRFERKFATLQVFKKIHGHVKVPLSFVIPDDDTNYAVEARGTQLGRWLQSIRRANHFVEHRQKLIDLGVDFSAIIHSFSYEIVLETLNTFKSVYGHSNVHPSFVVPSGDSRFPEMMWGVLLGKKITSWRKSWKKLREMGFTRLKGGPMPVENCNV